MFLTNFLMGSSFERIERAASWAHARRKLHEAQNESPFAARMLLEIQELYKIEATLRDDLTKDRRAVRQNESLPILHRIGLQLQTKHRPKSQTGRANNYTLGLWDKLLVYTEHVEIDNNLVENAIRPTAIGKKNWLFFGSADAGKTSAIFYTLIETCRKIGLNFSKGWKIAGTGPAEYPFSQTIALLGIHLAICSDTCCWRIAKKPSRSSKAWNDSSRSRSS